MEKRVITESKSCYDRNKPAPFRHREGHKYAILCNGKYFKKDSREWLHKSSDKKSAKNDGSPKNDTSKTFTHEVALGEIVQDSLDDVDNNLEEPISSSSYTNSRDKGNERHFKSVAARPAFSCIASLNMPRTPITNAELRHRRKRRNNSPVTATHRAHRVGEPVVYFDENANIVDQSDLQESLARNIGFRPIQDVLDDDLILSNDGGLFDDISMETRRESPPGQNEPKDVALSYSFWYNVMDENEDSKSSMGWRESKDNTYIHSDSSSQCNSTPDEDELRSPSLSHSPSKRNKVQSNTVVYRWNSLNEGLSIRELEDEDTLETPSGSPWEEEELKTKLKKSTVESSQSS